QRIEHVVNNVEQLQNQVAHRHFLLLTEIDHLAVETPTHCAPLVFLNQHAPVKAETEVLFNQHVELRDDRLKQRGDGNRIVNARGDVADSKFKGGEKWMRANIPPNLFAVIDTLRLD